MNSKTVTACNPVKAFPFLLPNNDGGICGPTVYRLQLYTYSVSELTSGITEFCDL